MIFFPFSFSEAILLSSSLSLWRECLSSRASRVKPAPSGMIPRQRRPQGTSTPSLPDSGQPYHTLHWLATTINNPPPHTHTHTHTAPRHHPPTQTHTHTHTYTQTHTHTHTHTTPLFFCLSVCLLSSSGQSASVNGGF